MQPVRGGIERQEKNSSQTPPQTLWDALNHATTLLMDAGLLGGLAAGVVAATGDCDDDALRAEFRAQVC